MNELTKLKNKIWWKWRGIRLTILGKWLKYNNQTAKDALRYFDNGSFKCGECGWRFNNSLQFEDHISDVHGYPRDIDLSRAMDGGGLIPPPKPIVKPCNKAYLKTINKWAGKP